MGCSGESSVGKSLTGYAGEKVYIRFMARMEGSGATRSRYAIIRESLLDEKAPIAAFTIAAHLFTLSTLHFTLSRRLALSCGGRTTSYSVNINGMDSGSAIPSTSREDFYSLPVLSPPVESPSCFRKVLDPFWSRQELNISESCTLAALRDYAVAETLLGQVRCQMPVRKWRPSDETYRESRLAVQHLHSAR